MAKDIIMMRKLGLPKLEIVLITFYIGYFYIGYGDLEQIFSYLGYCSLMWSKWRPDASYELFVERVLCVFLKNLYIQ